MAANSRRVCVCGGEDSRKPFYCYQYYAREDCLCGSLDCHVPEIGKKNESLFKYFCFPIHLPNGCFKFQTHKSPVRITVCTDYRLYRFANSFGLFGVFTPRPGSVLARLNCSCQTHGPTFLDQNAKKHVFLLQLPARAIVLCLCASLPTFLFRAKSVFSV